MAFKTLVMQLKQTLLCCSKHERQPSMDIGSPTNVRRVSLRSAFPGLTPVERKYLDEKASSDGIHLLGLHSHPPSHPPTSPPSPTTSCSLGAPASVLSSREPSEALLNAASRDLPAMLPTPPRRVHGENSPPAVRTKGMWHRGSEHGSGDGSTRDSTDGGASCASTAPDTVVPVLVEKDTTSSYMTLHLEFDFEDKQDRADSPRTLSLSDGFEEQSTTGGAAPVAERKKKKKKDKEEKESQRRIERAVQATALGDSSESEEDTFVSRETKPLVGVPMDGWREEGRREGV